MVYLLSLIVSGLYIGGCFIWW